MLPCLCIAGFTWMIRQWKPSWITVSSFPWNSVLLEFWEAALVYGVLPNPWFEYVWEDCNSKSGACRCNGLHWFSPALEILWHHHHGRFSDHGAPKAEKETITATHRWMRIFSLLLIHSFESTLEYMIMTNISISVNYIMIVKWVLEFRIKFGLFLRIVVFKHFQFRKKNGCGNLCLDWWANNWFSNWE